MNEWLKEPLFLAGIGWNQRWRTYLRQSHRHIVDTALERFQASIAPYQDWNQLGWVQVFEDAMVGGQGVRAVRDIPLPKSRSSRHQRDVAADLNCAAPGSFSPRTSRTRSTRSSSMVADACSMRAITGSAKSITCPCPCRRSAISDWPAKAS